MSETQSESINLDLLKQTIEQGREPHSTSQNPVMDPPIIIAGMYRGGTSLTTAAFALSGAWTGYTMPGNKFNPKGYFENEAFKSLIHLMIEISGYNDSDDLPPENLPALRPVSRLHHILETLMLAEGYNGGPWVIKNPKVPFFWQYFDQIFPKAKWILVRRNLDKVAESMGRVNVLSVPMKYGQLNQEDLRKVARGYDLRLDAVKRGIPSDRLRELNSEDVASEDFSKLRDIVEWAGLEFNEEAVSDFVEPSYFHKTDEKKET